MASAQTVGCAHYFPTFTGHPSNLPPSLPSQFRLKRVNQWATSCLRGCSLTPTPYNMYTIGAIAGNHEFIIPLIQFYTTVVISGNRTKPFRCQPGSLPDNDYVSTALRNLDTVYISINTEYQVFMRPAKSRQTQQYEMFHRCCVNFCFQAHRENLHQHLVMFGTMYRALFVNQQPSLVHLAVRAPTLVYRTNIGHDQTTLVTRKQLQTFNISTVQPRSYRDIIADGLELTYNSNTKHA